jgi:aminoglycoside phosphotransferase (APT) family kinase protein
MILKDTITIAPELLQQLCTRHHLGQIQTIVQPKRGAINLCYIVNDAYVLRFEVLEEHVNFRFSGEKVAYDRLQQSGLPVPRVIALDTSKTLVPYAYLITTKLPGMPLIDCWQTMTLAQREQAATETGRYLALMHAHTFDDGFYKLCDRETDFFATWSDYVWSFFREYASVLQQKQLMDSSVLQRAEQVLKRSEPLLKNITVGALVHADYHAENLLVADGHIMAVIDFEHAKAADPAWDFRIYEQWEDECPGFRAWLYAGYQQIRPLDTTHATRVRLYWMLKLLDDVDWFAGLNEFDDLKQTQQHLLTEIATLERELA